ncbi:MAG TPA: hypothetical protein EYO58_07230 [Flavobacteriales bacterium]|nr:hypothetical protein [Flavobacteriales bacterium]
MDLDSIKSIVEKSKEQYDKSIRWGFCTLLALMFFHLFVFSPFLKAEKKLAEVQVILARLPAQQEAVLALSAALTELADIPEKALNKHMDTMFKSLRSDFRRLSSWLRYLKSDAAVATQQDWQQGQGGQNHKPQMMAQMMLMPQNTGSDARVNISASQMGDISLRGTAANLPDFNSLQQALPQHMAKHNNMPFVRFEQKMAATPALIAEIRNTDNISALRSLLAPEIETKLIKPYFVELNKLWQRQILPSMQQQEKNILKKMATYKFSTDDIGYAGFSQMKHLLATTSQKAAQIRFQRPEKRFWWLSVEGKSSSLQAIKINVQKKLNPRGQLKSIRSQLLTRAAALRDDEKQLQAKILTLKKNFSKIIESRSSNIPFVGKPLAGIPMALLPFVEHFPLIVAISLSILFGFYVWYFSEFRSALEMSKKNNAAHPMVVWYQRRLSGSLLNILPLPAPIAFFVAGSFIWLFLGQYQLAQSLSMSFWWLFFESASAMLIITASAYYACFCMKKSQKNEVC